jgi:hypothetical protein
MIETKILCNNCRASGAYEVSYDIGGTVGASGNNATKCLYTDLCQKCHVNILTKIIRKHIDMWQIEQSLRDIKGIPSGPLADFPLFSESTY